MELPKVVLAASTLAPTMVSAQSYGPKEMLFKNTMTARVRISLLTGRSKVPKPAQPRCRLGLIPYLGDPFGQGIPPGVQGTRQQLPGRLTTGTVPAGSRGTPQQLPGRLTTGTLPAGSRARGDSPLVV